MEKIWKTIDGFSNYEISNYGDVISKERYTKHNLWGSCLRKKRLMRLSNHKGYLSLSLIDDDGNRKTICVHQLVAMAFLEHIPDGNIYEIDHINGIKTDNRLENLQILTHRDNVRKSSKNKTYKNINHCKYTNRFTTNLRYKGIILWMGRFDTKEEANEKLKYINNLIDNNVDISIIKEEVKKIQLNNRRINYHKTGKYNKRSKKVIQIKDGKIINEYVSITEATKETGIHNIGPCCRGKRSQSGGFNWAFVEKIIK